MSPRVTELFRWTDPTFMERDTEKRKTVNVSSRWKRAATALAVAAAALPLAIAAAAPATASAAALRTATKATHTDATHVQNVLGLATTGTDAVIESVTYDRFRSLLQQQGGFAFLIGDPAEDSTFAARAREVETAAEDAGLTKVYWFDPHASGDAKVGNSTWRNLVGPDLKSLSNAVPETAGKVESAKISGSDSYFFLSYRATGLASTSKIISWIDLSKEASSATTGADVSTAIKNDGNLAPVDALVIGHLAPREDGYACGSGAVTNPAQNPYPVEVQIDGQTYRDGCDTLPGYDDYACTAIPDVQYDFADNYIFYYDDQGDLLATAPWTEWSRITSYATWEQQQQAAATQNSTTTSSVTSTQGTSTTGSSGTGSSGSGSSGSGGSGSGSSGSGSSGSTVVLERGKVSKVVAAVSKAPTSKAAGKYKVTIDTPAGKPLATGKVKVSLFRVGAHSESLSGVLSHGVVTFAVPKLSKGTWKVLISWAGNKQYQAVSMLADAIKVTK